MDSSNRLACPEWEGSEYDNTDAVKVGGLSGSGGVEDATVWVWPEREDNKNAESGAAGAESRGCSTILVSTKLGIGVYSGVVVALADIPPKWFSLSPSPLSALPRRRSPYDSASAKASGSPLLTRLPEAEAYACAPIRRVSLASDS